MDDRQFDTLTRSLGGSSTRRQAIRSLMALAAGAVGFAARDASAARRGYGGPTNANNGDVTMTVDGVPSGTSGRCHPRATLRNLPPDATGAVIITAGHWSELPRIVNDGSGVAIVTAYEDVNMNEYVRFIGYLSDPTPFREVRGIQVRC